MSTELKPCPCGHRIGCSARDRDDGESLGGWEVYAICPLCGIRSGTFYAASEAEAMAKLGAAWNARPAEDALRERCDLLQRILDSFEPGPETQARIAAEERAHEAACRATDALGESACHAHWCAVLADALGLEVPDLRVPESGPPIDVRVDGYWKPVEAAVDALRTRLHAAEKARKALSEEVEFPACPRHEKPILPRLGCPACYDDTQQVEHLRGKLEVHAGARDRLMRALGLGADEEAWPSGTYYIDAAAEVIERQRDKIRALHAAEQKAAVLEGVAEAASRMIWAGYGGKYNVSELAEALNCLDRIDAPRTASDLAACPFCGSLDVAIIEALEGFHAECRQCAGRAGSEVQDRKRAIGRWNGRVGTAAEAIGLAPPDPRGETAGTGEERES